MEEQVKTTEKHKSNFLADFYNSRTPLWRGLLFVVIESLIPGIAVWLLVGIDVKSTSMADKLPDPRAGYAALISICYLLFVIGFTTFLFFVKAHKADNFTYSTTIAIVIAVITMLSYGMTMNNITFIFVKFIIAFVLIILGGIAGVFFTTIFSNISYKFNDDTEKLLDKEKNNEELSNRESRRLEKYYAQQAKLAKEKQHSDEVRKKLDEKLSVLLAEKEKELD